mmetsp:Transcript_61581/g.179971  ORF Transcript_61581/g.179971 Transcript_61581/m.179971 type:complete len:222 (-) Transcript_61581:75-740(-)
MLLLAVLRRRRPPRTPRLHRLPRALRQTLMTTARSGGRRLSCPSCQSFLRSSSTARTTTTVTSSWPATRSSAISPATRTTSRTSQPVALATPAAPGVTPHLATSTQAASKTRRATRSTSGSSAPPASMRRTIPFLTSATPWMRQATLLTSSASALLASLRMGALPKGLAAQLTAVTASPSTARIDAHSVCVGGWRGGSMDSDPLPPEQPWHRHREHFVHVS